MKIILRSLFCLIFLLSVGLLSAQKIEHVKVLSNKMGIEIDNVVILPKGYDGVKSYPIVYLLHGFGGKQDTWMSIKPDLPEKASKFDMIIVCPDGKKSWYWDSPIDPASQFETYVSKELIGYIDKNYKTVHSAKGRAVTGFSMGGHGGLWLGINHPEVFGACGSMSGGVDIRPFPNNWEMKKSLGTYADNTKVWDQHTVIEQLHKIKSGTLNMIIDCGTGDFFFEVNENLHKKMLLNNIPHEYITRPGKHDGAYWRNAVDYQLLFFQKFFQK